MVQRPTTKYQPIRLLHCWLRSFLFFTEHCPKRLSMTVWTFCGSFISYFILVLIMYLYIHPFTYKPVLRTVVGKYWSEVFTVWTKYSQVTTQQVERVWRKEIFHKVDSSLNTKLMHRKGHYTYETFNIFYLDCASTNISTCSLSANTYSVYFAAAFMKERNSWVTCSFLPSHWNLIEFIALCVVF